MRPGRRDTLNRFLTEDPIFNRNDCDYAPVRRFGPARRVTGGLETTCLLDGGKRRTLTVTFHESGILRFRLGRPRTNRYSGIDLNVPSPARGLRYRLDGDRPSIRSGRATLVLDRKEGTFRLLRGGESLLDWSEPNERAWFGHITYQLGLGKAHGGEAFSYLSFRLLPGEKIYGGGEHFSGLDHRGRRLKGWICDTLGLNSSPLLYKWVPFFLSSRRFGVFFNAPARATAEIGSVSCTAASFRFYEPALEFFVFTADSRRRILCDYTALTGRAPRIPAWSYGIWLSRCAYGRRSEVERTANDARRLGFPADVVNIDTAWQTNRRIYDFNATDFVWDHARFPAPEEMCRGLAENNFRVSLWINPYVWTPTGPAHEHRDMLLRDKAGDVVFTTLSTQQAIYDFTHPAARRFYRAQLRKLLAVGVSVFKTDYGENIPERARFHCGETGTHMHNLFPYLYNREVYETAKDVLGDDALVWGRSGFAGSQRFPVCWSGDSQATWEVAAQVLCAGLSAAISGIPFWSCDIGGFVGQPDDELFVRWSQFGLLTSHARFHGNGFREPWRFGRRAYRIVKQFADLRYRLITYLHNLGIEASCTGMPVIRPMALAFEDDPVCEGITDQYMLGEALLIRPVFTPGATSARVYLPAGRWIDFFTRRIHKGPAFVEMPAPLERIPVLQRAGTVVPLNDPMPYVDQKRFGRLRLRLFDCPKRTVRLAVPGRPTTLRVGLPAARGYRTVEVSVRP